MKKKLVIVCGGDGSGKSSLSRYISSEGFGLSNYQLLKNTHFATNLDFKEPGKKICKSKGERRIKLIRKWIHAEKKFIEHSYQKNEIMVSDGYYLRFFAKETAFGLISADSIKTLIDNDYEKYFIMLDVAPKVSLRRKAKANQKIKPYETFDVDDEEAYIDFQMKQTEVIRNYISRFPSITIDTNEIDENSACRHAMSFLKNKKIQI